MLILYLCSCVDVVFSEQHSAPGRPSEESAGGDEDCEKRCWESPSFGPVSTGCQALDHALLVHLKNCSAQLLVRIMI